MPLFVVGIAAALAIAVAALVAPNIPKFFDRMTGTSPPAIHRSVNGK